jgi:spore cortex formation protein SpoVR/YcgB (stage V sporulation)
VLKYTPHHGSRLDERTKYQVINYIQHLWGHTVSLEDGVDPVQEELPLHAGFLMY